MYAGTKHVQRRTTLVFVSQFSETAPSAY